MKITLYHFESCPYCRRVRDFIAAQGLNVPMKDTHKDPTAKDELLKIGGKTQVPCLVIDGKALYESLDIIEWLRKNYAK